MAKWFKTIWAQSGDKSIIPETLDPSGYVSYEAGYPLDYERVKGTDPLAKSPTRQEFNEVLYEVTGAINQYQTHGFPDYIDATTNGGTAYAYQIGAAVRFTDGNNYINLVASNTSAPDVSGWALFSDFASSISAAASKAIPADLDSFGITDSAASGIIKKTTWAQIKTALQSIFATLASPTFTGTPAAPTAPVGTNTTQLATTAYVVGNCIGVNQTWQDVTASRTPGVLYTNSTGKPIMVIVSFATTTNTVNSSQLSVDGIPISFDVNQGGTGGNCSVSVIVPNASTYSADNSGNVYTLWMELR